MYTALSDHPQDRETQEGSNDWSGWSLNIAPFGSLSDHQHLSCALHCPIYVAPVTRTCAEQGAWGEVVVEVRLRFFPVLEVSTPKLWWTRSGPASSFWQKSQVQGDSRDENCSG